MIVLECIPYQLAQRSVGSCFDSGNWDWRGAETDGQVLVFHDMVQYGSHHIPKFVEKFADAGTVIHEGIKTYVASVKDGSFPAEQHRFTMKEEELTALYGSKIGE